jgi:prepilin-type N-terminal cleavage/methylation domain-containing protein
MTLSVGSFDGSVFARPMHRRSGLTLIELLVVLFIVSVLLSLLLPAVQAARTKMQASACQNNIRQLTFALGGSIWTTKRFPEPNRWSVGLLKWMEEWPLADEMSSAIDPNGQYPRPRPFRCPMQDDFSSRVDHVRISHYILTVDRPIPRGKAVRVRWEIHDREILNEGEPQEPWYFAPELSFVGQAQYFSNKTGPHPPGLFMTARGFKPK